MGKLKKRSEDKNSLTTCNRVLELIDLSSYPVPLEHLAEVGFGGDGVVGGVKGIPRWLSRLTFWIVVLFQFVLICCLLASNSLTTDQTAKVDVDGDGVIDQEWEVNHDCEVDTIHTYHFVGLCFLLYFCALITSDALTFVWAFYAAQDDYKVDPCAEGNFWTLFAIVAQFVLVLLFGIAIGMIMAAGRDIENIIGNGIAIFVILQMDDAVKDMFNAYGCVVKDEERRIYHCKWRIQLGDDDAQVNRWTFKALMTTLFILPMLSGLIAWGVALGNSPCVTNS